MIANKFIQLLILNALVFSTLYSNEYNSRAIVESNVRSVMSSEIGGKIISTLKGTGESFKKNETLILIDCKVYDAQRNKAAVKRDIAKAKMEKNHELQQYNTVGKFDVLLSELEYKEQKFEYEITKLNAQRCRIKAPFDGKVVQTVVKKYQNVKPQEELMEILSDNSMEIRSVVPAKWIRWIKPNMKVTIFIEELGREIIGSVKFLDAIIDPTSQTVNIRVDFENKDEIIPGMSGIIYFDKDNKKGSM